MSERNLNNVFKVLERYIQQTANMDGTTSTLTNLFTDLSRFCQNEEYEKAIKVTNKSDGTTSTLTNLFTDLSRFCQNEEYEKAIKVTNKLRVCTHIL